MQGTMFDSSKLGSFLVWWDDEINIQLAPYLGGKFSVSEIQHRKNEFTTGKPRNGNSEAMFDVVCVKRDRWQVFWEFGQVPL